MSQPKNYVYEERFRIFLLILLFFFVVDVVGFVFIVAVVSEEFACHLNGMDWFVELWPPNAINTEILRAHPAAKLDICRVIPATAWSAAVGIAMLLALVLFDIIHKRERMLFRNIHIPLALLFAGIFMMLPIKTIGPSVIEYGRAAYSINIRYPIHFIESGLLILSFIPFYVISMSLIFLMAHVRWRKLVAVRKLNEHIP